MDSIDIFLKYLPYLRQTAFASSSQQVAFETKQKLSDDDFIEAVKKESNKLDSIIKFREKVQEKGCLVAEAVDAWLDVPIIFGNAHDWNLANEKICSSAALIAYSLHPKFRGKKLPPKASSKANELLLSQLKNDDLVGLINFRNSADSFGNPALEEFSPKLFWEFFKGEYKELSELALKFTFLPASACGKKDEEQEQSFKLSPQQLEKIEIMKQNLKNL